MCAGDPAVLTEHFGPDVVRACELLAGERRRVYDAWYAVQLTRRYEDVVGLRAFGPLSRTALRLFAHDRDTYVAVLSECLFRAWVPASADVRALSDAVAHPWVGAIDDFAALGFRADLSLLGVADGKLLRALTFELVAQRGRHDEAGLLSLVADVGACARQDATWGEVLGVLRRQLDASGAGRVRSWPALYARSARRPGGWAAGVEQVRAALDEVAVTAGLDVAAFLEAGIDGDLEQLTGIARRI